MEPAFRGSKWFSTVTVIMAALVVSAAVSVTEQRLRHRYDYVVVVVSVAVSVANSRRPWTPGRSPIHASRPSGRDMTLDVSMRKLQESEPKVNQKSANNSTRTSIHRSIVMVWRVVR